MCTDRGRVITVSTTRSSASREQRSRLDRQQARLEMLRRRRRAGVLAILAVAALLVGVDLGRGNTRGTAPAPAATPSADADAPVGDEIARPAGTPAAPAGVRVPARGKGSFAVAPGSTPVTGRGRLLRYEVQVEQGIGQRAARFAAAVDRTLADPRSWTAGGEWAFQRVSHGEADFVIRLASPATVDRLCFPLDTNGYTSCRVQNTVVVNLARWLLAVPDFGGDIATYRLYVINHEVGHRLGKGHLGCPAAGRSAPVMLQQTLGLQGCRPNAWPYLGGRLVTGPPSAAQ
jgi:hypothetical protein